MYPKTHNIIEYKKQLFIYNCADEVKGIIEKVIENTIHISFETFMTYLIKNFKKIITNKSNINKDIYIYITEDFIEKSNYWIYQLLNYYKSKIGFNGNLIIISSLNDEKLKDNDIIFIVDDCIYSGEQLKLVIEEMNNNRNLKLNIYLFISFMTNKGLDKVKKEFSENSNLNNCKLLLVHYIYYIDKSINNYLFDNEIKILEEYYSIDIKNRYLIYFDHKMADYYSTIPLIYSGIVANSKNKELLFQIRKNKKIDLKKELDYIQFINKTDEIRNINVMQPEIIKPPYLK
jgi:orotate phosphoribosyltransferase-like protein